MARFAVVKKMHDTSLGYLFADIQCEKDGVTACRHWIRDEGVGGCEYFIIEVVDLVKTKSTILAESIPFEIMEVPEDCEHKDQHGCCELHKHEKCSDIIEICPKEQPGFEATAVIAPAKETVDKETDVVHAIPDVDLGKIAKDTASGHNKLFDPTTEENGDPV